MLGRTLPLNGAGVCGAALADLGLPLELLRGFALLARTAGLIGQLAEELRRPVGNDVYLSVDLQRPPYVPTRPARSPKPVRGGPHGHVAAVIASTHHPFYYRASTVDRRGPAAVRRRVGRARSSAFRETLTRAEPDVLVMVGSDHFHQLWLDNMPQFLVGKAPFYDANWYNEEREFGLPRMTLRGQEDLSAHLLRDGLDAGFDLAFSNELRIDHSITCPIITLRPAGRPADRADLHQHLRAAAAAAASGSSQLGRAIRRDGRVAGRATSGWRSSAPATCRWSSAARASSARTARTRSSTARPSSGSPPATSRAAWPR